MPFVKNPYDDDREVVVRSKGDVVFVKAGDWVEVPEEEAKSLEQQGWELRKTEPTKKGGS